MVGCASANHASPDDASPDGCTLGTPDHCGTCTTVCPGVDNASTQRTCAASTCGLTCKGEFYDLDGNAANGCEAEDQPVQDASGTAVAVALPDVNNGTGSTACDGATNPCTVLGQIYSDQRTHDSAPTSRPLGREDWYRVTATGNGSPNNNVTACLGITNYPADNQYEVCIGENNSTSPTTCMTATGGASSVCVAPAAATSTGTFYVRIRKVAGTNTANQYALFLVH